MSSNRGVHVDLVYVVDLLIQLAHWIQSALALFTRKMEGQNFICIYLFAWNVYILFGLGNKLYLNYLLAAIVGFEMHANNRTLVIAFNARLAYGLLLVNCT